MQSDSPAMVGRGERQLAAWPTRSGVRRYLPRRWQPLAIDGAGGLSDLRWSPVGPP